MKHGKTGVETNQNVARHWRIVEWRSSFCISANDVDDATFGVLSDSNDCGGEWQNLGYPWFVLGNGDSRETT